MYSFNNNHPSERPMNAKKIVELFDYRIVYFFLLQQKVLLILFQMRTLLGIPGASNIQRCYRHNSLLQLQQQQQIGIGLSQSPMHFPLGGPSSKRLCLESSAALLYPQCAQESYTARISTGWMAGYCMYQNLRPCPYKNFWWLVPFSALISLL